MSTKPKNNPTPSVQKQEQRAPALPWGHKILREKALLLLKQTSAAPSLVMANLMIAAANKTLDVEILSQQAKPMSSEVNRIIATSLAKSRMPNADMSAILDELISLVWINKVSPPPEPMVRKPLNRQVAAPKKHNQTKAPKPVAPIIVRKSAKLSDSNG